MNQTFLRLLFFFFLVNSASANNMLVQNVTTTGNDAVNKTIQVQFDISWDNSWRDAINWDAAWIFMKFKDANGLWQHVQLNQTGFANGTGTVNTLQVTSDKVGSWLYRSAQGSGTFNTTGMQLQWNYGLSGLTNVTGLEVRVFAVEMVYVPEGGYSMSNTTGQFGSIGLNAPGGGRPVINDRLTPTLSNNIRIKGNTGIDYNNDGIVENTSYPTGYSPFYVMKYEMTEQQYADFLNTLTTTEKTILGTAGSTISLNNGEYFASSPNRACGGYTANRYLFYKDWAGLTMISQLEMNKLIFGSLTPYSISGSAGASNVGALATNTTTFSNSGATYYGIQDMGGNLSDPFFSLSNSNYNRSIGNGNPDISQIVNRSNTIIEFQDSAQSFGGPFFGGFPVLASGGSSLIDKASYFGGIAIVTLSDINTSGHTNITLSYIASKFNCEGSVSLQYSIDGINWFSVSYTDVLNNYSDIFYPINSGSVISLPSNASNQSNLRLRWIFNTIYDYDGYYRIDDVFIRGVSSQLTTIYSTNFGNTTVDNDLLIAGPPTLRRTVSPNLSVSSCCGSVDTGFRYCRTIE